jgi:DNA-binding FadR family transcriptional regulator
VPSEEIIQRRKLSDEVRRRLLDMIESGELPPGSALPSERELMARYQVGRPAVREAMQSLETMRMVSIRHGERARVVPLTPRSMLAQMHHTTRHLLATSPETRQHLKAAREMFETGMVRRAAEAATEADLEGLRSVIEEMQEEVSNPARFVALDIRFHNLLAEISGNPILQAVSEAMLQWLFEFHSELVRFPGHEDVTLADHQEIYKRVAERDVEGAERAMIDHLTRANAQSRKRSRTKIRRLTGSPSRRVSRSPRRNL